MSSDMFTKYYSPPASGFPKEILHSESKCKYNMNIFFQRIQRTDLSEFSTLKNIPYLLSNLSMFPVYGLGARYSFNETQLNRFLLTTIITPLSSKKFTLKKPSPNTVD